MASRSASMASTGTREGCPNSKLPEAIRSDLRDMKATRVRSGRRPEALITDNMRKAQTRPRAEPQNPAGAKAVTELACPAEASSKASIPPSEFPAMCGRSMPSALKVSTAA